MRRLIKFVGYTFVLLTFVMLVLILIFRAPDRPVEDLKTKWAKPPSQFVEIAGMMVHLRDEGPRDTNIPIVLLHGTSSSLHTWDGWANALKKEHRVIRFDMPAFGLTGPSPENNYTIEAYAKMVVDVLDTLDVNRCVLAGNSLGGYISWATALLYPDRAEKLVLIDASGYPYEAQSVPIGFQVAQIPVIRTLVKDVMPRAIVASSLKNVYGDPSRVTPELIDRYFDITTREGNRDALVERFQQTRPGPLAHRVPELKLPTLILWGGKDQLIPPSYGDRFHREIENSQVVLFDGLGHVPQEEDPGQTVAALKTFLDQP